MHLCVWVCHCDSKIVSEAFVSVYLIVPVKVTLCECANCQPLSALWNCAFGCPQDTECINGLHSCKYEQSLSGWTKSQMGFSQSFLFSMSQTCVLGRATHHRMAGQGQCRLQHFSLTAEPLVFFSPCFCVCVDHLAFTVSALRQCSQRASRWCIATGNPQPHSQRISAAEVMRFVVVMMKLLFD